MARVALFLMLTAMQISVAVAEVCDKVDESWNIGGLPVLIHPFGGWPKLISPYLLLLFLPTTAIATLVWKRRCKANAALWFMVVWILAALGSVVLGLLGDASDVVLQAAISEGCVALSWTGGAEFPMVCLFVALLLLFCWDRRKAAIPLRIET
jgi:hypothetical protein